MALNRLVSFTHAILVNVSCADAERKNELEKLGGMKTTGGFQMPLHYPRYGKSDYEKMEEWKLDMLLREYGLCFDGSLDDKRKFAMGAFLWPHQY